MEQLHGREEGAPPPVDLKVERRNGEFVRGLITAGCVCTVHDVSDGGLAVAIAEMAVASGIGASVAAPAGALRSAFWFGEDQARYVLTANAVEAGRIVAEAKLAGIPAFVLGITLGEALKIDGEGEIPVARLRQGHEEWLPKLMAGA